MKPLADQNNIEKARLLHVLFPGEIRGFISFAATTAETIIKEPEKVKDDWGSKKPLSADVWIKLAEDVSKRIAKNQEELVKNKSRFSDQLFEGYTAMFTIQCLQDYTVINPNSRFIKAIELFFDV